MFTDMKSLIMFGGMFGVGGGLGRGGEKLVGRESGSLYFSQKKKNIFGYYFVLQILGSKVQGSKTQEEVGLTYKYSRSSMARTLMACLPRLFRTPS